MQSERDNLNLPSKNEDEINDGTPTNDDKTNSQSSSPKTEQTEQFPRKSEFLPGGVTDTTSLTFEENVNFSENEVIITGGYYGGYEECIREGCDDGGEVEEPRQEFQEGIERNQSASTSTQVDPMQFGRFNKQKLTTDALKV